MKHRAAFAALMLTIMFSSTVTGQTMPGLPDAPHITVVGSGEAEAPATSLDIEFHITVTGKTQEKAKVDCDERASNLAKALNRLGVKPTGFVISELTLNIEHDYNEDPPVVAGYNASRTFEVTLTDFTLFDAVIEAAIKSGVTSFYGSTLHSADDDGLNKQALSRGIENAKTQAQSIAENFGMKLGRVYSITTSEARTWGRASYGYGGGIFGDPDDEADISFEAGPVKSSQQIYVTFFLIPG